METPSPPPPSYHLSRLKEHTLQIKAQLWDIQRYNLHTFLSQPLTEISGSFGDIGTLLPLLIALTQTNSIFLSSTLVFSGLANILTGLTFGLPLPVQPMKAIAAVAIAQNFTRAETASAGLFVAACLTLLSATGLIHRFTHIIPTPIIKGIQLGTGLSLIISAGTLYPGPYLESALTLTLAFLALLLASTTFRRLPYALLVLLLGILTILVWNNGWPLDRRIWAPALTLWRPRAFVPDSSAFRTGMLEAGIGQLPLTTLNSVIAVTFLAQDLLPERPTPSTTSIALSVASINLVACWFGAMPVCHGSGGLAAQYRFGARSGASVIFLGLLKLVLGLFASEIALYYSINFPTTLLVILLIAAGLELVKVGESLNTTGAKDLDPLARSSLDVQGDEDDSVDRKQAFELGEEERKRRWMVMFMTVGGILAFKNDAVGFLAGMLCHWSFRWQDWWDERTARGVGQIRLGDEIRSHETVEEGRHEGP